MQLYNLLIVDSKAMASSLTRTEAPKDEPRIIIFQQPQPWQLHQPKLNQHLSRSRHHPRRKCAEAVLQGAQVYIFMGLWPAVLM
ncbi:hypothetical protein V6N13_090587 [Hibiscus sabdariffa]